MKIADKLEGIMKEVAELEKQTDEPYVRDLWVEVATFKRSGKWYSMEHIGVPNNLNKYDSRYWLESHIKGESSLREFNCVCINSSVLDYPLFVPACDVEEEKKYEPIAF